jgi:hypothetical protein
VVAVKAPSRASAASRPGCTWTPPLPGLAAATILAGSWQLTWAAPEKPVALIRAVTVLEPGGTCPARSRYMPPPGLVSGMVVGRGR